MYTHITYQQNRCPKLHHHNRGRVPAGVHEIPTSLLGSQLQSKHDHVSWRYVCMYLCIYLCMHACWSTNIDFNDICVWTVLRSPAGEYRVDHGKSPTKKGWRSHLRTMTRSTGRSASQITITDQDMKSAYYLTTVLDKNLIKVIPLLWCDRYLIYPICKL